VAVSSIKKIINGASILMRINYGKDFVVLKVLGVFIILVALHKFYEAYLKFPHGVSETISIIQVFSLLISFLIAVYCLTAFWVIELRPDKIVSSYGCLFINRRKEFNGIERIEFRVKFIEVKNGPDKAYLSVLVKPENRDRAYPIASMHQLKNGILPDSRYRRAFDKEAYEFNERLKELKSLYPKNAIDVGEKVEEFYSYLLGAEFNWQ
jgi:hypothetical protein